MSDERIELTEVQAVLEGLSSPTDEQFVQALRYYSDTGVAMAAAKRGLDGGGGGSLPDWWTVDSTPGSESVEIGGEMFIGQTGDDQPDTSVLSLLAFSGTADIFRVKDESGSNVVAVGPTGAVTISPSADDAVGLTLEHDGLDWDDTILINTPDPSTLNGNYYVFRIHNVDADVDAVVIDADGHMNLEGPQAQLHVIDSVGNSEFTFNPSETIGPVAFRSNVGTWYLEQDSSMRMSAGGAFDDGNITTGQVRMFYDSANGAAKIKFRGRTQDDTLVSGEIALT